MHCVCRPGTPKLALCLVVNVVVSLCAAYCWIIQTCCCWMSPPTILMLNRWPGLNGFFRSIRVPWWPSRMIATSLIMRPAGFWNWTVAAVFHMRATTLPGWSRKINGWNRKPRKKPRTAKRLMLSWNGCVRVPKVVRPNPKRV